jgi:hypothetical protein
MFWSKTTGASQPERPAASITLTVRDVTPRGGVMQPDRPLDAREAPDHERELKLLRLPPETTPRELAAVRSLLRARAFRVPAVDASGWLARIREALAANQGRFRSPDEVVQHVAECDRRHLPPGTWRQTLRRALKNETDGQDGRPSR